MIQIPHDSPRKKQIQVGKNADPPLRLHKDSRLLLGHTRTMCKAPFVVVQTKTRQQDGNPSRYCKRCRHRFPQELRDAADHTKMA